jgi:hypothetical protein
MEHWTGKYFYINFLLESLKILIRIELDLPLADLQRQSTTQVLLWSLNIPFQNRNSNERTNSDCIVSMFRSI